MKVRHLALTAFLAVTPLILATGVAPAASAAPAVGIPSPNTQWNGYVTKSARATNVIADWTVPLLQNCTFGNRVGQWIGLGGVGTPLVQIGIKSTCGQGYDGSNVGVWQVVPEQSSSQVISGCNIECTVTPGDDIQAQVRYMGGNRYFISITDDSSDWTWSKTVTQPASSAAPQTAEWILEGQLDTIGYTPWVPDFGTAEFTDCFWGSGTGLHTLTSAIKYEAGTGHGLETSVGSIGQYGGAGPWFDVTWLRS